MFYVKEITTAANTSKADSIETDRRVWAGVIHRVEVVFPPGCAGLLHVTIHHGGHQIYPSEELQDFIGDDEVISFNDFYELVPGDNLIRIKTWNEDDTFDHKVIIRMGILPKEYLYPEYVFQDIANSLRWLLRRIGVIR
jgi:hypothetical protein